MNHELPVVVIVNQRPQHLNTQLSKVILATYLEQCSDISTKFY